MSEPETGVRLPAMRNEVKYAISALADESFQRATWPQNVKPRPGYCYDFDMAIQALLDDTTIVSDPNQMLGDILSDADELAAVVTLSTALLVLIEDIGINGSYADATASSAWPDVLSAANRAQVALGRPSHFP